MSRLYKLTDQNGQTRGGTQWGEGVSHSGTGEGKLCGPGYIHAYEDPLIAVLLNPIHADFKNPRLLEAEGDIALRDGKLKCGCVALTTLKEIPVPVFTTEMRVTFAILCAKEVYPEPSFVAWADGWLSGADRTAWAAAEAAEEAEEAEEAEAAKAAWAAAEAAEAAEAAWAAWAAAWAAAEAEAADVDIVSIAKKVYDENNGKENGQ